MRITITSAILALILTIHITGCTNKKAPRTPSSINGAYNPIDIPNDLELASKQLLDFLNSEEFSATNCGPALSSIYENIFEKDADFFDRTAIGSGAFPILNNLWLAKLSLRDHLDKFTKNQTIQPDCIHASRSMLRAIRFTEDYIGGAKLYGNEITTKPRKAFSGGFPYLMTHPNENDFEMQSGDVLLSRGMAFTSAAIARIGDDDAQFSHLAILYIDEDTGKKYVVEAHIEIGTLVTTFENYASDGKARALLFRQTNKNLAKLAAKKIYDLATKATASGSNIPYDFGMDLKDRREVFCSEVVEYAYHLAAKELGIDFKMPLFLTTFKMKNRSFLDGIGVKVKETFAPADIEVDSRFQLVAEWRDYGRVRTTHYHDAILTEMFRWMEAYNYELHGDPASFISKNFLWSARRWPLFSELLKNKFPRNMTKNALETMILLNDVSNELMESVTEADKKYYEKTGLLMTPIQMRKSLELFREEDLATYQEYEKERANSSDENGSHLPAPKFHWRFRAR